MSKYIMGIDNGSQSTKVTIFDLKGNQICYGSKALKNLYTAEGGVVLHPDDDLWDSVHDGIKDCLSKFHGNKNDILAIGLCTIRCCRALLKEDGSLAYPVLSWMDNRLSKPYIHENDEVKYVTTTSGYLANRMTGSFKDTCSNLEVYWPIDIETLEWSEDDKVIEANGLKRNQLFKIIQPGESYGSLKSKLCKEYGLKENIQVVATGNDKAVEALGSGINGDKSIMISLGTFISSMLVRDEYFEGAQNFFPTLACVPFKYVYESTGIRRGMWTVSWYKNILGDEVRNKAKELNISEEEYLNQIGGTVPPGSDGLITLLDWLNSSSHDFRKGIMLGFDHRHTNAHIYRSILEAISYNIKNNIYDMLDEIGSEIDNIIVIGGGSKSNLMMQIIADMFGLPTKRNEATSCACLGAAICTTKYLGIYDSFDEAIENMVRVKEVFEPNKNLYSFYDKINNKVIKNVRKHTDEVLKVAHSIF
ncbi:MULTISPECIES: FGGY-family carbohydrate kinase [Psychrilyobacter]|uniref:Sugar kinase n=1 Tax=Psychrilyobacter piezotolerans TaxID=2293438 RepID=A0ABX9KDI1_9FUSO|nr:MULTISPECIES: FGGY family carbohydrate kinase [Psychrilyobacter]MCS5422436.1 FGGY family carbohydrate kinase [Psychrilyobacter sp. S5]NDI79069.1 sugar kinase [Psychrilyobacter piezotolerans]RDE59029.1 sugar kinase [Psychrilyobacter sp. S5]REI39606.1 sugar kinase [Psychrilyobacter piezotolerans]